MGLTKHSHDWGKKSKVRSRRQYHDVNSNFTQVTILQERKPTKIYRLNASVWLLCKGWEWESEPKGLKKERKQKRGLVQVQRQCAIS